MKYRLWCTICVLDLQTSLDWATEPQIDLEAEHYSLPRNINDADFDMSFQGADIPDRDELTDITFSLVTYKAQLSGRLLDFKGTTVSTTSNSSSPGHAATTVWERRLGEARRFEDQTRRLLAACDPESSAYAWFTFHETNSIISSMRLSALRPLHHRAGLLRAPPPPPRAQGANDRALAAALGVLGKSQLVRSDPRGEGFRWSVRTQWHALSVAVAECLVCADEQLLASAWPVVEAAYESACAVQQQHQHQPHGVGAAAAAAADHCRRVGAPGQPLQVLMLKTRARVKRLLRGASVRGAVKTPAVGGERTEWSSPRTKTPASPLALQSPSLMGLAGTKEAAAADPLALPTPLDFGLGPTPVLTPSNSSPDRGTGASASLAQGLGEVWSLMPAYSSSMAEISMGDEVDLEAGPELSWQAWEDILTGVTPKEGFFDSSSGLC